MLNTPAAQQLLNHANNYISMKIPKCPAVYYCPHYFKDPNGHYEAKSDFELICFMARTMSLAYHITMETRYLNKLEHIVTEWSKMQWCSNKDDSQMVLCYKGQALIQSMHIIEKSGVTDSVLSEWIANVYHPAVTQLKAKSRRNNHFSWALYGELLCADLFDTKSIVLTVGEEIKEHIAYSTADLYCLLGRKGEFWRENLRNNSGMWYTYFSLAPLTRAAYLLKTKYGMNLFGLLEEPLSAYFLYASKAREWPKVFPYKKYSGILGKIQHILWPSEDSVVIEPGYNLFEAMSYIYQSPAYSRHCQHRPIIGGNVWRYPTLYHDLDWI